MSDFKTRVFSHLRIGLVPTNQVLLISEGGWHWTFIGISRIVTLSKRSKGDLDLVTCPLIVIQTATPIAEERNDGEVVLEGQSGGESMQHALRHEN